MTALLHALLLELSMVLASPQPARSSLTTAMATPTSLAAAASRANGPSPVTYATPLPPSPCLAGAEALPLSRVMRAERVGHRFPPHSSESILLAAAIAVALLLLAVVASRTTHHRSESNRVRRALRSSGRHAGRACLALVLVAIQMAPVSSRMIPWENHAIVYRQGFEHEFIEVTTGARCEDTPGFTSIYTHGECEYAANTIRCNPTFGIIRCGGNTGEPCGCQSSGSGGALTGFQEIQIKFARSCGMSGAPCTAEKPCMCRDVVGSYHQVRGGTCENPTNPGGGPYTQRYGSARQNNAQRGPFFEITSPEECRMAGSLIQTRGNPMGIRCTERAWPPAAGGQPPKCSFHANRVAYYRDDNHTNDNTPDVTRCSSSKPCICKRPRPNGQWIWGSAGQSCTQTCASQGRVCDANEHKYINTLSEFEALLRPGAGSLNGPGIDFITPGGPGTDCNVNPGLCHHYENPGIYGGSDPTGSNYQWCSLTPFMVHSDPNFNAGYPRGMYCRDGESGAARTCDDSPTSLPNLGSNNAYRACYCVPPPPSPPPGDWFLGIEGQSCYSACTTRGRTCDPALAFEANLALGTQATMQAIAEPLRAATFGNSRRQCTNFGCQADGNTLWAPFVRRDNGDCCWRPASSSSNQMCSATPDTDPNPYRRLCWCNAPPPPAPPFYPPGMIMSLSSPPPMAPAAAAMAACACNGASVSASPTSTCRATGDPHYLNFQHRKFDFYARGLFEHARFSILPCNCEVIIQSLQVKLIRGRYRANSAQGAVAVRVGTITFTMYGAGIVTVIRPGEPDLQIQPAPEASTTQFGDCTLVRETMGRRSWAWRLVFPGNAGSYLVRECRESDLTRTASPLLSPPCTIHLSCIVCSLCSGSRPLQRRPVGTVEFDASRILLQHLAHNLAGGPEQCASRRPLQRPVLEAVHPIPAVHDLPEQLPPR